GLADRDGGPLKELVDQTDEQRRRPAFLNPAMILLAKVEQRQGLLVRLGRRLVHATEKEVDPGHPIPELAHPQQEVHVAVAVSLEKRAQVEERAIEATVADQEEGNQEPADPAVAIAERMDRFELVVDES